MATDTFTWTAVAAAASALAALSWAAPRALQRLQLSRAKHRSLAGHSRWSQRLARWLPGYELRDAAALAADGAPAAVQAQRQEALQALSRAWQERYPRGMALTAAAKTALSDLQLTSAYRVPFAFSRWVQEVLPPAYFFEAASGCTLTCADGHEYLDLTGAYGVNLFGVDFYKRCIEEGASRVAAIGPVLGPLHPIAAANAQALKRLSGMDEVSFHMSGTEAVMQAVRLARYHTGRSHLVRFCGAYHGWWDDVQPGPGNPLPAERTYTLAEMSEDTLTVLRTRRDIACVLVNPLQALHVNRPAPGDSTLQTGRSGPAFDDKARREYSQWLQRLRAVCSERGIVLILDEVFMGFRLAPGGAQAYFGVQADLVTYGKTLGGGLPVGVLCGRAHLMKRFRTDHPADLCFARGTFNAHPYVMGAMQVFLEQLASPGVRTLYDGADVRWAERAHQLNARLQTAGLPVRVAQLGTVWTVLYTQPGRYHWLLQFYLRLQGVALSWVGSGRLIFGLHWREADFELFSQRLLAAAQPMQAAGWWWQGSQHSAKGLQRQLAREVVRAARRRLAGAFSGDAPALQVEPATGRAAGGTAPSSTG
jgi:glutamate-1-semialdehyde 2,1-aminomutase